MERKKYAVLSTVIERIDKTNLDDRRMSYHFVSTRGQNAKRSIDRLVWKLHSILNGKFTRKGMVLSSKNAKNEPPLYVICLMFLIILLIESIFI